MLQKRRYTVMYSTELSAAPTTIPDMKVRFYIDPGTAEPHLHVHGIDEAEVIEVLSAPLEDGSGRQGARVAIGRTKGDRFLRVIYVPDPIGDGVFVITAYEVGPKALKALRRRMRGRT